MTPDTCCEMKRYPWRLLPRLGSEIEHHRRKEALADLDSLLQITWEQSMEDLNIWKLRCAQVASTGVRAAMRGGAPGDKAMDGQLRFLRRLGQLETRAKIQDLMHRYLDSLLDGVRPVRCSNIEHAVAQVRRGLRKTLGASRSLAEYAQMLGVSEGHLSRCFAAIVGQTFRKERRRLRMEAACRILTRSRLKISAIAPQIGISDPSQFVADFRKEFGMTPGHYRRKHIKT